jgi:hypothetical protein
MAKHWWQQHQNRIQGISKSLNDANAYARRRCRSRAPMKLNLLLERPPSASASVTCRLMET